MTVVGIQNKINDETNNHPVADNDQWIVSEQEINTGALASHLHGPNSKAKVSEEQRKKRRREISAVHYAKNAEVIRKKCRKQMAEKRAAEKAKRRKPEQRRRAKLASDERDAAAALARMLALKKAQSPLPPSSEESASDESDEEDAWVEPWIETAEDALQAFLGDGVAGQEPEVECDEEAPEEPNGEEGLHTPVAAAARVFGFRQEVHLSRRRAMRGRLRLPTPTRSPSPTPEGSGGKLPSFYEKLWATLEKKNNIRKSRCL
ncbi:hypothetical protein C8R44DRAFT_733332 [Mycena epipterygia]|nr:hypothetical protein C8R44DRAFT_733332 [Mycena epipterygia]